MLKIPMLTENIDGNSSSINSTKNVMKKQCQNDSFDINDYIFAYPLDGIVNL